MRLRTIGNVCAYVQLAKCRSYIVVVARSVTDARPRVAVHSLHSYWKRSRSSGDAAEQNVQVVGRFDGGEAGRP